MPIDGISGGLGKLLFDSRLLPRVSVVLGILLFMMLWVLAVIVASIADDTLRLPEPGRGLLNHYGFHVSVVAALFVVLTTYCALSYFLRTLRDIDNLLQTNADVSVVRAIVKPHIQSLFLRRKWSGVLALFMFIGVACSIVIFRKLDAPNTYWGNDVFNATSYRYGYLAGNGFFLCLWGFIYPIVIFYALHLTLSSEIIVSRLKKRNLFRLDFLNVDKCGGMSRFGTLNLLIMLIYVWPFGAIFAFHFTHRLTYSSLVIAAIAMSILFIVQSFYGIYAVSRTISAERKAAVSVLNGQIARAMKGNRKNFSAVGATLQYRERVMTVSLFPYSDGISIAVNVLRLAPATVAVLQYFAQ